MSSSAYRVIADSANRARSLIQKELEEYQIQDLADGEIRAVIEARLVQEWHTHNTSTLPDILRDVCSIREAGGTAAVFEEIKKLEDKANHANEELNELIIFLINAELTRIDLSWERAEDEIAAFSAGILKNHQVYHQQVVKELSDSVDHLKALVLPMGSLRSIIECFKLPAPSAQHVDAAMRVISHVRDFKDKCDAIIRVVDHAGNAQTIRHELQAIEGIWKTPVRIMLWIGRQIRLQNEAFNRLAAIIDGSSFLPPTIRVSVMAGSVTKITFKFLTEMCEGLRDIKEMCTRGCKAYDDMSAPMQKYIRLLRQDKALRREMIPTQWATRDIAVFQGIMHKCFLQVVDPVRLLEDPQYAQQVVQAEQ